jgi:RNA polymerase sigma-70 factor (ECF subfamily)
MVAMPTPKGLTVARTESAADRFRHTLDAHLGFVWRTLRRFGVPEADADDAAQEVFLVFARKLSTVPVGREKWFVFNVAVNRALQRRRVLACRPERLDDDLSDVRDPAAGDPESLLVRKQRIDLVDRVLASMLIELSTVLVLCDIEHLTMAEVAEALELPAGTVASRLRRARECFRLAVEKEETR